MVHLLLCIKKCICILFIYNFSISGTDIIHYNSLDFIYLFFTNLSFCVFSLRKELLAEQREYKKKKAQKKVLRMKELEQEREVQKSKWQQFNNKAYSKNKKGQVCI